LVPMEPNISGMLVDRNGSSIIGVNASHHPNRRRFSIAHELGHALLHDDVSRQFVDSYTVAFRNAASSLGIDRHEVEANAFAAELLMPRNEIANYLQEHTLDAHDERQLDRMASRFGVSIQALSIRLAGLGYDTTGSDITD